MQFKLLYDGHHFVQFLVMCRPMYAGFCQSKGQRNLFWSRPIFRTSLPMDSVKINTNPQNCVNNVVNKIISNLYRPRANKLFTLLINDLIT